MSIEDEQYDRENYSLIIINFLDTDLEDNSKAVALIYLNGELDDTIKIKGSTTIFIHKQDILTFEIKDMSPPQTIGVLDIATLQLLQENERLFQKWLPSIYNQKMHKFLFEFEIQKMGTLSSSKILRNQNQVNEVESGQQPNRNSQLQSQLSGSDKYIPCIQSTQLNNGNQQVINKSEDSSKMQNQSPVKQTANQEYQKYLDNEISQNKQTKSQSHEAQTSQKNGEDNSQQQKEIFTISPIKVIEDQDIKKNGYTFQKFKQNNQLTLNDGQVDSSLINSNGDNLIIQSSQLNKNQISPNGPSQAIFMTESNEIYDVLEDELVKLAKKIQNKSFNSLIEKRRSQYLELKNLLQEISEQFEALKKHPCRGCEKKYIPSIQKGIQKLYSGYKQLMSQISQSQQIQNSQQLQQQQSQRHQMPVQEFIQSLSASKKGIAQVQAKQNTQRSKSPITTRSLQVPQQGVSGSNGKQNKYIEQQQNVSNQQLSKQTTTYQMSPNNSRKLDKVKEEEAKTHNLQVNSDYIRNQLETQFKRTHELEVENKQLKLRNFILEGDLKNLLKRIQQEKLTFSSRATFKLQEFRQIFEYFHSLRLERESLLDEIHQLQDELKIGQQGDKKKNSFNTNNHKQNNTQLKSIQQTMNEYAKYKQDTLQAVQQEEQRIENEGRSYRYPSSFSQQYTYPNHQSNSLSPKLRDNYSNQITQQYGIDELSQLNQDKYPSYKYEDQTFQNGGLYQKNDISNILKTSQNSYPQYNRDNSGQKHISKSIRENNSPSQQGGAYDTRSKENGPSSSGSTRSEIHHLLNQRKNVINELLEKIGEI
ncbi:hypothetical protein TTHERM_00051900 (macronuclear) [Tetrahymena thermophila SB210]|uniref:Uncharacterized protein n=1 Tax=Tetrahymena thermophila (strain SB210) TaxID=312017 RepID=Q23CZ9_TETTS|nr:hypothetical protein TTHERM_00051900 [Tetrahymena thermophila SB210]EAR94588.1 hypothetical protein TTHERM_00051900 [Tetrahymena thermophila SB210]|eukprot:XP_001014887.1 hypothetical protein TTHERM_00051900 [Tetrahymena thermophila SB210]